MNTIRRADAELALDLSFKGRKEEARKVLERTDKMMLESNFPYGLVSRGNEHNRYSILFLQAAYQADDKALADKVLKSIRTDLQQQIKYYNGLTGSKAENMQYEKSTTQALLGDLDKIEQSFNTKLPKLPETGSVIGGADSSPASKK